MQETQKINLPTYFLNRPRIFHIRNVEEYRLFLESYCIGKQLDYFYFRVKFDKFLIKSKIDNLTYNEETNYPDWVTIVRFRSSSDDQMSLNILKDELEVFIDQNINDKKILEIFIDI